MTDIGPPAEMFYVLTCLECLPPLPMPFATAAERGKWAAEHIRATGHDRWIVTDEPGHVTSPDIPPQAITDAAEPVTVDDSTDTHELALRIQRAWDERFSKPMDSGSRGLDYQMALLAAETVLQAAAPHLAAAQRDLLTEAADALWESSKAALVVKPTLDVPYPDDPRWTPWTRWVEPKARQAHDLAMRIRKHLREQP